MGPRTEAGAEQHLRLRLIPADPYYRVFIPPVDIGLQIKVGKPSFMESFGPLFLLCFYWRAVLRSCIMLGVQ